MPKTDLDQFAGFTAFIQVAGEEVLKEEADAARAAIIDLAKEIVSENPKYTGASSGEATGMHLPPSHPANRLGLSVGNLFNGGESGWQAGEDKLNNGRRYEFYLFNPMWDYYLEFIEFGVASSSNPGFVNRAWEGFLAKQDY